MGKRLVRYWTTCIFIISLCLATMSQEDNGDESDTYVTTEEDDVPEVDEVDYVSPAIPSSAYLAEHFDDVGRFRHKWVLSEAKKDNIDEDIAKYDGKWEVEGPLKDGLKGDLGLVLKSKAKHSAISSRLEHPFNFVDKPLIVQYEVTFQDGQECGGAYLKLLSVGKSITDLRTFHDKTPYTIMFGPDKCGNDHKLHFIFRHKNPVNGSISEKHAKKPKDRLEEPFKDKLPHLYTLVVRPDNTFTVSVDRKVVNEGNLLEDFTPPVNPPAEIDDPNDKKPEDWDEREKIPDPDAQKPEDWDESAPAMIPDSTATMPEGWLESEPEMIPDPTAEKPDDWDTDMDGDWEAPLVSNPRCEGAPGCGPWKRPLISNPAYKGKWHAPLIDNPNYKGKWKPRRIPNPDYFQDDNPYKMMSIGAVGFELWSMSNMILFDNLIITDDSKVAESWAAATFSLKRRKIDKDSESLFMRLLTYTNDQPWLWAVYVIVIGLPVVLIFVFCCGSSQEKQQQQKAAEAKKTDAVLPDDEVKPPRSSKSELEIQEVKEEDENQDDKGDEEDDESVQVLNDTENELSSTDGGGDAQRSPRKRRVRKD